MSKKIESRKIRSNIRNKSLRVLRGATTLATVLSQYNRKAGIPAKAAIIISAGIAAAEMINAVTPDLSNEPFFNSEEHYAFPIKLFPTIVTLLENVKISPASMYGNVGYSTGENLWTGEIDGHKVYWISEGVYSIHHNENFNAKTTKQGCFCEREIKDQVLQALRRKFWQLHTTVHLDSDSGALTHHEESVSFQIQETSDMKKVIQRLYAFRAAGKHRSYLLIGSPGTGKTTISIAAIQKLGLRSLRMEIRKAETGNGFSGASPKNIEAFLDFAQPEILVLDDLDRSMLQPADVLQILEYAKKHCKIVISTANTKGSMIGAMLRAGRIDDHIIIEKPDQAIVRQMLDEEDRNDQEIVERLSGWPIAYISNYIDIKEVFGREQARVEIDLIEKIIKEVESKTMEEGKLPPMILSGQNS